MINSIEDCLVDAMMLCRSEHITKICNALLRKKRRKKISRISQKEIVTVLFVAPDRKAFALEQLVMEMTDNPRFNPILGVPYYNHLDKKIGCDYEKYDDSINYFREKGYSYISLAGDRQQIRKRLKEISPDIIFFNCTYGLKSMRDILSCSANSITAQVSYGYFLTNLQQAQFNTKATNGMDFLFWESPTTLQMSRQYSANRGDNSYFVGYPKLDALLCHEASKNPWKPQEHNKKRIIWAPHHSIEENETEYGFSCFLYLSEYMLELAEKYREDIQLAFKPHPLLKHRLYAEPSWGREKTDEYYYKWEKIENGQLEIGGYDDLFLTSDAMIMDSISFMCEYTALNKPCLFTVRDKTINNKFNELGQMVYDVAMYKSDTNMEDSIEKFIKQVVIEEKDVIKDKRSDFINRELIIPNGKSASENIMNFLIEKIGEK